jgi:hypothetical protein
VANKLAIPASSFGGKNSKEMVFFWARRVAIFMEARAPYTNPGAGKALFGACS